MANLNLPVVVFLFVLLTQLVAWVGKTALQELAFGLYTRLFLAGSEKAQKRLRAQVLQDKAELSKTSSQDEFAKWAKLKRKVDKGLADLEKTNNTLSSARASFTVRFSTFIWVITTGASFFLAWWYRRVPVFYVPAGWVPGPVAWLLAFPGAPRGSVSVGAWSTVCKQVLLTAEGIVKTLLTPTPVAEPMPVPAEMPEMAGTTMSKGDLRPAKIEEIHTDELD
ncbi:hypothetical protein CcaverHIS002_0207730 [Cutaneotrichosporon cavernicola]|uniref:Guided entry of tail-anchored proteins 1 n=1 Tax=Cutaneotrichosporon cavernicola TaxID=279322 RepID=A0AA48I7R9_9TREE|nr:uncharacterized protein CcaverHIS019_0207720 [Cutaneotrichosporon cavernicola]BEI81613.1 hypothetical protein CcaverHIS002_0207730 [Cutaneotrichosporon cavernicola]BEI89410.1 hypothetical protein CcaverHIS019_0207720 [Cutaneotrichosporon cavernicola]BEI97184.1 hypothetical protein CcaverHIS631_0207730 [Cutaneotrichosporon cavernicola]BEJ04957.1 hypothetical protein CcaverHIS641_0207740 [Cutaneotrichosporon cavernicola]